MGLTGARGEAASGFPSVSAIAPLIAVLRTSASSRVRILLLSLLVIVFAS